METFREPLFKPDPTLLPLTSGQLHFPASPAQRCGHVTLFLVSYKQEGPKASQEDFQGLSAPWSLPFPLREEVKAGALAVILCHEATLRTQGRDAEKSSHTATVVEPGPIFTESSSCCLTPGLYPDPWVHTNVDSFPEPGGRWPSMLRISWVTPSQCPLPADSVRCKRDKGRLLSRPPPMAAIAVAVTVGLRGSPGSGKDE